MGLGNDLGLSAGLGAWQEVLGLGARLCPECRSEQSCLGTGLHCQLHAIKQGSERPHDSPQLSRRWRWMSPWVSECSVLSLSCKQLKLPPGHGHDVLASTESRRPAGYLLGPSVPHLSLSIQPSPLCPV